MAISELTTSAVDAALAEFERLGRSAFLGQYGFGEASKYFIHRDGRRYDSKAIAGVAHGYLPGRDTLRSHDFTGGDSSVAQKLRLLGYRVPPTHAPDWTRDEIILACDLVAKNDWKYLTAADPEVVEVSALLQKLPLHPIEVRPEEFRNANGVARKTVDIATQHPDYAKKATKGNALDRIVLAEFLDDPVRMGTVAAAIRRSIENDDLVEKVQVAFEDENGEALEGRLLQRVHFVRERDPKLRARKINEFLRTHDSVRCEVCMFDFEKRYGERGQGYIEVHHVLPLHESGETITKLGHLELLCANCHRMIHRGSPWLTPDELRRRLTTSS